MYYYYYYLILTTDFGKKHFGGPICEWHTIRKPVRWGSQIWAWFPAEVYRKRLLLGWSQQQIWLSHHCGSGYQAEKYGPQIWRKIGRIEEIDEKGQKTCAKMSSKLNWSLYSLKWTLSRHLSSLCSPKCPITIWVYSMLAVYCNI